MLTDAFLEVLWAVLHGVVDVLVAMLPTPPAWLGGQLNQIPMIYTLVMDFDTWLPINTALLATGWILAVNVLVTLLQLLRMFISYSTFGGGAISK